VIVDTVDLARSRPTGCDRDREPHVWMLVTDARGDRPLPDCRRAGQHHEP
jgi:hypothetical protein